MQRARGRADDTSCKFRRLHGGSVAPIIAEVKRVLFEADVQPTSTDRESKRPRTSFDWIASDGSAAIPRFFSSSLFLEGVSFSVVDGLVRNKHEVL